MTTADWPVIVDDILIGGLIFAAVFTAERSFVTKFILVMKELVSCNGICTIQAFDFGILASLKFCFRGVTV